MRELRDSAYVLPNEAPRRVMILAGAQGMTEQAQNALLKILEEPPAHAVFLLTCENRASMLPTILSRVQCVSLGPVPEEEALPILKQRLPDQGEEALRRSFRLFGGIIGRTLQGLEDGTFQRVLELAPRLAEAVCAPDELTLLRATAPLEKDKAAVDGVLGAVRLIFRDALMRRCAGDAPEGAVASLSVSPETADQAGRRPDPQPADGVDAGGGRTAGRPAAQHEPHPAADPHLRPVPGGGRPVREERFSTKMGGNPWLS